MNQSNSNEGMGADLIRTQAKTRAGFLPLVLGLALLGAAATARADDLLVATFDTDISALGL
jgi:hypothetical protein